MPDILSTVDVMKRYGCERHTAANIVKSLPFFKVGKRMFIKLIDLQNWEESKLQYPVTRQMTQMSTKISRRRL